MASKEIQQKIMSLLQGNARMPDEEIADRLQLKPQQVREIIRSLETEGEILGYHALVDAEFKGDTSVRAIIEVEVQPERDGGFDRVAKTISKFDEVVSVFLVSGRYDLRLEVVGPTLQEVAAFVASKLAPLNGVQATATHFMLKKYKDAGFVLEKDKAYERLKISP
ncbi:MAG: Lrp/AsnC family transcriptional regulator [Lentisphaeria bacterium]